MFSAAGRWLWEDQMTKRIAFFLMFVLLIAYSASAQQARVKGNRTPLRDEPTTTSTALTYYQAGAVLLVLDSGNGWYRVRDLQTGTEGYVKATLVELLPGPAPVPRPPGRPGATALPPESKATPSPSLPAASQAGAKPPAKTPKGWTDRAYLSVGGVYQAGVPAFSDELSYTEYVEQSTVTTDYPSTKGWAYDFGGAMKLWRSLAIGASVTVATRSDDGSVNATIPHPFYFNSGRAISGTASLERTEDAVHLFALWGIPVGRQVLIVVGGGPSFFYLKQSLVRGVSYSHSYPFDTATFSSASVEQPSAWAVGYGASADIAYYFSSHVGIGGVVRYARATVSLPSKDSTTSVDAGGFEGGLGLRVRLPQGKPKKVPPKQPVPAKPVRK